MSKPLRVTVWNEFVHERELPEIRAVYPEGIHGCIRRFLGREADIAVTCVIEQGANGTDAGFAVRDVFDYYFEKTESE